MSYSKGLLAAIAALGALFTGVFAAVVLLGGSVGFREWPSPPRGGESKARAPQQLRRVSPSKLADLAAARAAGTGGRRGSGSASSSTAGGGGTPRLILPGPGVPGPGALLAQSQTPGRPGGTPPAAAPAPNQPTPPPVTPTTPVGVVQSPSEVPSPVGGIVRGPDQGGNAGTFLHPARPITQTQEVLSRSAPTSPLPEFPPGLPEPQGLLPPVFPPPTDEAEHGHHADRSGGGRRHKQRQRKHKRRHHRHGHDHGQADRRRHRSGSGTSDTPRGRGVGRQVGSVPKRHLGWTRGRHLGWTIGLRRAPSPVSPPRRARRKQRAFGRALGHLVWHKHHGWRRRK